MGFGIAQPFFFRMSIRYIGADNPKRAPIYTFYPDLTPASEFDRVMITVSILK